MTHHEGEHAQGSAPHAEHQTAGGTDEWQEVRRSLDELGDAMTRWANAVKDDPESRRYASEIQQGFESIGRDVGRVLESAAESDFARQMTHAVGKTGEAAYDAAKTAGKELKPLVASAFRTAAEGIKYVADRLDEGREAKVEPVGTHAASSTEPHGAAEPGAAAAPSTEPHPSPSPAPHGFDEPPAPAPSGTPGVDPGEH